jgi:hypothetical protein
MHGTAVSDKSITFMTPYVCVREPILPSATGVPFVLEASSSSSPRIQADLANYPVGIGSSSVSGVIKKSEA